MSEKLSKKVRIQIASAVISIAVVIAIGTIAYSFWFEKWTWIEAFYFSVITLTTVGFGDLHPTNDLSRLFTAFYIIIGVGIMAGSLGVVGSTFLEMRERRILERREKSEKNESE